MSFQLDPSAFVECLGQNEQPPAEESDLSDILSSDSDESSLDGLTAALEKDQEKEDAKEDDRGYTKRNEELERMYFYSIYIDSMPAKDKEVVVPQTSEGFDKLEEYDQSTKAARFAEASKYVIEELNEEKFNELLTTKINEDEGIDDIEGNISIQTMCDQNFKKLRMDGPCRRIALLFRYEPEDRPLSFSFLHFMQCEKEKFPFIGGVLLYYPSGLGIHIIEASEYVLLMHFPVFFKSELFKLISDCKVLGVEALSAKKNFEHYSCYRGYPPEGSTIELRDPSKSTTNLECMKQIGAGLNAFLKYIQNDFPSITEENDLPPDVEVLLPSTELLEFALGSDWKPGLRNVKQWFNHLTVVPGETDCAEFVWPPRSDMFPVHIFHPAPGEEDMLSSHLARKIREQKDEELEQKNSKK